MANSEDLQFGTVSDILTVSSSWQSEHEAEHIEAEKVGVSVIGNDFIFVKGKKVRPLKKGNEKSIISFNIFTILEHENVELKETDSQHVGLGYKVLKENIWECPWKTVVKSRQGDGSNKCQKSDSNSLKISCARCRLISNMASLSGSLPPGSVMYLLNLYSVALRFPGSRHLVSLSYTRFILADSWVTAFSILSFSC